MLLTLLNFATFILKTFYYYETSIVYPLLSIFMITIIIHIHDYVYYYNIMDDFYVQIWFCLYKRSIPWINHIPLMYISHMCINTYMSVSVSMLYAMCVLVQLCGIDRISYAIYRQKEAKKKK